LNISGAQSIVKSLVEQKVDFVFGLPGTHNLELVNALIDSPINNILVTSELCAVFMADGYARATGRVGVCIAIPGPGLTNMITGLAEAFLDSSPIVVIVTTTTEDGYTFHTHEIPQLATVKPVVKGIFEVDDGTKIPEIISQAFHLASCEEPGPVVVEILNSVLKSKSDFSRFVPPAGVAVSLPDTRQRIEEIVKMINGAGQCGIYVGKGAQSSSEKVRQLAEHLSAPVATTISGKGVLAEDHELSVGFGFGPAGLKAAEAVFKRCDVVLAMGVKFSEMSAGKWLKFPGALIHIDSNRNNLNRNYNAKLALCQDVGAALEAILSQLAGTAKKSNPDLIQEIKSQKQAHLKSLRSALSPKGIHPSCFFYRLGQTLNRQATVVTDCGAHQLWATTDYCATTPNSFLSPSDYQAMGFGIPAAIGASLGCPEKCTVCVCGDGGFLMTGFEMLTAVRNNLNLAVAIFNDGALGHIKSTQRIIYGRTALVELNNPDFRQLASAFKVDYLAVQNESQLDAGLERIKQNRGVVLLDIRIDYQEWPDYMKGIARAAWQRLSVMKKLDLIATRAFRLLKYGN